MAALRLNTPLTLCAHFLYQLRQVREFAWSSLHVTRPHLNPQILVSLVQKVVMDFGVFKLLSVRCAIPL